MYNIVFIYTRNACTYICIILYVLYVHYMCQRGCSYYTQGHPLSVWCDCLNAWFNQSDAHQLCSRYSIYAHMYVHHGTEISDIFSQVYWQYGTVCRPFPWHTSCTAGEVAQLATTASTPIIQHLYTQALDISCSLQVSLTTIDKFTYASSWTQSTINSSRLQSTHATHHSENTLRQH